MIKTKKNGFSLIEVMISIVILSAISVMVGHTSSTSISSSDRTIQKTLSSWIASDRIGELRVKLRLVGELGDTDFEEKEVTSLGNTYTSDILVIKNTKNVQRIEVRIFDQDDKKTPITTVTSFLPVINGAI